MSFMLQHGEMAFIVDFHHVRGYSMRTVHCQSTIPSISDEAHRVPPSSSHCKKYEWRLADDWPVFSPILLRLVRWSTVIVE